MAGGTGKVKARVRPLRPIHRPTTEIVVTPKHSFEMVRTAMTATISHVMWARKVFPDVVYDIRTYDAADPSVDYEDFMSGDKAKPVTFDPTEDLFTWKVMPRGKNPRMDKMLDCLEIGATDALEKGYLQQLQLTFHSWDNAPVNESNLIESYTMTFSYGNGTEIKVSTEIESQSVVLRSAKQGLYNMVTDVGVLICNLMKYRSDYQRLPENFRMFMSLKYHPHAPADYQAPSFYPAEQNIARLLGMAKLDETMTTLTGHHKVSVDVQLYDNNNPATPPQRVPIHTAIQLGMSFSSELDGDRTQPEAISDINGIAGFRDPNRGTQDTMPIQKTQSSQQTSLQDPQVESDALSRLVYTQRALDRLKAVKTQARQKDSKLHHGHESQAQVTCECDAGGSENDAAEGLFYCAICSQLKHAVCYGYLETPVPEDLICYICLLKDEDAERLEKRMKPLCLKRRALCYLRERATLTASSQDDAFGSFLNLSSTQAMQLLNKLKGEGYVKGHGKKKKGDPAPVFTYVNKEEKVRKNYFRPEREIDHLFAVPTAAGQLGSESDQDSPIPIRGASSLSWTLHPPKLTSTSLQRAANSDLEGSSTQGTPSPRMLKRPAEESISSTSGKIQRVANVSPWLFRNGQ